MLTYRSKVVAAVTFGAVSRSRDQNFTVGRGKDYDGTRARTSAQLKALSRYSDVLLDYCHYGDPICAVGSEQQDVNEHLNYFLQHNSEVTKCVDAMAKANSDGDVSARPTKPVAAVVSPSPVSDASSSSSASPTSSVAARPAKASSSGEAPTPIPDASVTDGSAAAQQTGATGAAGSLTVAMGHLTAMAVAVAFFL